MVHRTRHVLRFFAPLALMVGCGDGETGLNAPGVHGGGHAGAGQGVGGAGGVVLGGSRSSLGGMTSTTVLAGGSTSGGLPQSTVGGRLSEEGGMPAFGGSASSSFGGFAGSGSMGIGGAGGASGSAPSCAERFNCDDRNPCTRDSCVESGCVHEMVEDGLPCSDGDICTAEDRCSQGRCGGQPRASDAEILGSLYGYGGYREDNALYRGTALVLSKDRIVFLDSTRTGSRLSLVKVGSQGELVLLDQLPAPQVLASVSVSLWLGYSVPAFNMVALGTNRFVLAGSGLPKYYQARVIDVVDDHLVERSSLKKLVGGSLFTTTGRGSTFWSLTASGLDEYLVGGDGSISAGRSHLSTGRYTGIQAALSPDGNVLFQAQLLGIKRWDLTTEPPTVLTSLWSGRSFIGLEVNDIHLAVQEGTQKLGAGTIAGIQVYRTADTSSVANFPADDTHQPIAFKLIDGGDPHRVGSLGWSHSSLGEQGVSVHRR
ncbi:MAG: hypothetical protein QM784_09285 [Polyangiaceae bacterium]